MTHRSNSDLPQQRGERAPDLGAVLARRRLLQGSAAGLALFGLARASGSDVAGSASTASPSSLRFKELGARLTADLAVADGHSQQVLLRQGDPLLPGAAAYAPGRIDAAEQARAFGSGNDYLAFLPLPRGSRNSNHGLLFCNHESVYPRLQFPPPDTDASVEQLKRRAAAERAAVGASIVELRLNESTGRWAPVADSGLARRLTADTPIALGGPAAGHPRLRTAADPTGRRVLGTLGNCAGGMTPWGTVLTAEENVQEAFGGDPGAAPESERGALARMGFGRPVYGWSAFEPRFDLGHEPNEANRFGWIVEVDPYDPESLPIKRTALGRFCHEGANTALCPDGRVAVYMGDDSKGEYLYRFVSARACDLEHPERNRDLLDAGTLSVARLEPDGRLTWMPLVFGEGPLDDTSGFESQADVVIEARRAADLLGATPLDRPEDVELQPTTGRVYVALTKNDERGAQWPVDRANPRPGNLHGQVLELRPPSAAAGDAPDHAACEYAWDVFLLAGNPRDAAHGARVHPETTGDGWFSCPDNLAFDAAGHLWIATDGNPSVNRRGDGLFACDTDGAGRALVRHFLSVPLGAEACGPCFTPDGRTLFVSVQHPGSVTGASFESPATRWPDFEEGVPPRDAVVAVRRTDGEPIG